MEEEKALTMEQHFPVRDCFYPGSNFVLFLHIKYEWKFNMAISTMLL